MKYVTPFLLSLLLSACASSTRTEKATSAMAFEPGQPLHFKIELRPELPVFGLVDVRDQKSNQYGILYQGGSYAALVAQVAAHAVIENAMQSGASGKAQKMANEVVQDYANTIAATTEASVLSNAINSLPADVSNQFRLWSNASAFNAWTIELSPSYFIAQSQDSIVGFTSMRIYQSADDNFAARGLIAVSSPAQLRNADNSINSTAFRAAIEEINTELITMAITAANQWNQPVNQTQKTWTYYQGRSKRFERAQLVYRNCDRATLQTLRGEWMNVPLKKTSTAKCSNSGMALR